MNHWKLGLLALASAFVLTACLTTTPTPPPAPPPPPSPPTPPSPPPPPATITVAGRVLSFTSQPLVNVPVLITGRPSTRTDANGNFSVTGVTAPYDATVVIKADKVGLVYKGLTRTDPTLMFLTFASASRLGTATVNGTLSGGVGFPEPNDHVARVAFSSPEASSSATAESKTGAYSMNLSFVPTTTTGSIYALQWQKDGSGFPSDYKGFGTKTGVVLSSSGTFNNQDVGMANVTEASIVGSVTVPAGYTTLYRSLTAIFGENGRIPLLSDSSTIPNFTYITPNLGNLTLSLATGSSLPAGDLVIVNKSGLAVNATGVNITIPAAPSPSLPVNAATGITTNTDFSWTAFSGGVYAFQIRSASTGLEYTIVTAGTTTRIPDLSSLELPLVAGANYTWQVAGFAPFASVDAAASTNGFLGPLELFFLGSAATDVGIGLSANRSFTTAP